MARFNLQNISRRPPIVTAALTLIALAGILLVNRLVNRFHEQRKALARHLYAQGLQQQGSGNYPLATQYFRAALQYSENNFDYQLSLARALRDSGHTAEAQSYLISLWERNPQDAAVNLALGRLAAREHSLDQALQYYHNAIYGVWSADANTSRLNAWLELVQFLLQQGAFPQAQAELILLAEESPRNTEMRVHLGDLCLRAQDYGHGLSEYQAALQTDRTNVDALAGAGQAAFMLGRYRTASRYLQSALHANPQNTQAAQLLETSKMVLDSDSLAAFLPNAERVRRLRDDFKEAGARLQACAQSRGIDLSSSQTPNQDSGPDTPNQQDPSSILNDLNQQWLSLKPKIARTGGENSDILRNGMELVFTIEQTTARQCGPPSGRDEALLLLSQNPEGVDR